MTRDLVTIFDGSPVEAQILRTYLDECGFFTYLAHETIKVIDPFITGFGMFDLKLQVPPNQVEGALKAMQELKEKKPAAEKPEPEGPIERLNVSGVRLRWSCILVNLVGVIPFLGCVVALLWLMFFFRYMDEVVRAKIRPRFHGMTIACVPLAVIHGATSISMLWFVLKNSGYI
jgi:hypothetical protein